LHASIAAGRVSKHRPIAVIPRVASLPRQADSLTEQERYQATTPPQELRNPA